VSRLNAALAVMKGRSLFTKVRALQQAQLEPLAKVGGSLSMYIPHVTDDNVPCWANDRVIRSLYEA